MEPRNTRQNKLIYYITIPLITILIGINIFFIYTNINLKNKLNINENTLSNQKNEYNNINQEYQDIQNEINKLENIDNLISEARTNYYKTLKTFEDKVSNKEVNYKIAYLTFDDGPYYLTHKYLDILEKYNVRATFFTIGLDKESCFDNRNQKCSTLYEKEAKYGHTMANHTYSHLIFNGLYSSSSSFIHQVEKQEKLIKEKTGLTTNIVRFPGGIATSGSLRDSIISKLRERGYGWVDWTASNGDGGYVPNATTAMNNLKKTIDEDIEVILFHDYSYVTLEILPDVIEYLEKENYILLPLFYESKMIHK